MAEEIALKGRQLNPRGGFFPEEQADPTSSMSVAQDQVADSASPPNVHAPAEAQAHSEAPASIDGAKAADGSIAETAAGHETHTYLEESGSASL